MSAPAPFPLDVPGTLRAGELLAAMDRADRGQWFSPKWDQRFHVYAFRDRGGTVEHVAVDDDDAEMAAARRDGGIYVRTEIVATKGGA